MSAGAAIICKLDLGLDGPLPRWLPPRAASRRSVSSHPDFSIGLLEHAHDMSVNQPKETIHNGLTPWPWHSHTVMCVIAHRCKRQVSPRQPTQGVTTRRLDSWRSQSLTTIPTPEANNATSLLGVLFRNILFRHRQLQIHVFFTSLFWTKGSVLYPLFCTLFSLNNTSW